MIFQDQATPERPFPTVVRTIAVDVLVVFFIHLAYAHTHTHARARANTGSYTLSYNTQPQIFRDDVVYSVRHTHAGLWSERSRYGWRERWGWGDEEERIAEGVRRRTRECTWTKRMNKGARESKPKRGFGALMALRAHVTMETATLPLPLMLLLLLLRQTYRGALFISTRNKKTL